MAFSRTHSSTADSSFTASGKADWEAAHTVSGATVGGIPYCPTATSETTSANLTYAETSGPRLQVGSGTGATQGWYIGQASNNISGLWTTGISGTKNSANAAISQDNSGNTQLNAASGLSIGIGNNGNAVMSFTGAGTDGRGPYIAPGTAITDVQALSAMQTWNNGAIIFTHEKHVVTDIASAAGSLLVDYQTGSGSQFSVGKTGLITTGGTAGVASFGPALPTSITVKNGIITAIS